MTTSEYSEITFLVERLHRRFLDVLKVEMTRMGYRDINAVQGLLLAHVGDGDALVRDLVERGYYQGSNASYNIRKLVDYGYLEQDKAEHDKRSSRISLTEKGQKLVSAITALEARQKEALEKAIGPEELKATIAVLRRLEHQWSDAVTYPYAAQ
ncbi:MAG: MarR family winged helix-turn-helix transcriptional regulator [Rhodospirillaceae bacterium]